MPFAERDLRDVVSFEGFDFDHYQRDEQLIIKPQLEGAGYSNISFFDEAIGDQIVRKCKATATGSHFSLIGAEGKAFYFYYG